MTSIGAAGRTRSDTSRNTNDAKVAALQKARYAKAKAATRGGAGTAMAQRSGTGHIKRD